MNNAYLLAEISELERLLANTPESSVIDRISLQARKAQIEKELAAPPEQRGNNPIIANAIAPIDPWTAHQFRGYPAWLPVPEITPSEAGRVALEWPDARVSCVVDTRTNIGYWHSPNSDAPKQINLSDKRGMAELLKLIEEAHK